MKKMIIFSLLLFSHAAFSQTSGEIKAFENSKTDFVSEISKEKIALYDTSFQNFITALKNSDKNKISALVSDQLRESSSPDFIRKLSGGISFNRKMEVYQSGYQKFADSKTYPAIQYRFSDDKTLPPKDFVVVVFEENGKIMSIKPEFSK